MKINHRHARDSFDVGISCDGASIEADVTQLEQVGHGRKWMPTKDFATSAIEMGLEALRMRCEKSAISVEDPNIPFVKTLAEHLTDWELRELARVVVAKFPKEFSEVEE